MGQDKNERRSKTRPGTEERHEELRTALLEAAQRAIDRKGLAALRARWLADEVGCSVGAIYLVFPDLDALVLAVNGRTLDAIDRAMAATFPGGDPIGHLVRLAEAYLDHAAGTTLLWSALFQHAMPAGRMVPDWYAARREAAFSYVEEPLRTLCPGMPDAQRALLARSLFSAVHGMVALGLDRKVAAMSLDVLRDQIGIVVRAAARGLAR